MEHALQVKILKELMAQLDEDRNVDAGVRYTMATTSYVCPSRLRWSESSSSRIIHS